jgi:hypothetical protein
MRVFCAQTGKPWHSFFTNPIVNQFEPGRVRERRHAGPADDIRGMLTAESVEAMAGRALCLENALSPEVKLQTGSGLFAVRVLAKNGAGRAESNQRQPKFESDSPDHVALPGFRTSEAASLRKPQCIPLRENCLLGIGDIRR